MSTTLCVNPICKCVRLVTKINLLRPASIEEISSFMREPGSRCEKNASDYWSMRTIQIDWGYSSEVITVHKVALDSINQEVIEYLPF
jgi:hypothetical protein